MPRLSSAGKTRALSLWTGKQLWSNYRLLQLLGRGGFGQVWEAEAAGGKTVALKFLACDGGIAPSQEIRAIHMIRQLSHPHLVSIEQVWCERGYLVVTMELADGSLQDLLEAYRIEVGTPVAPDEACRYLAQAAQALDFLNYGAHLLDGQTGGIQHCDIKPSNLLLFGEVVKLCDFGLASPLTTSVTSHRKAGTLDYAAPEVFQGCLSRWTDQYALAVTYCQLRGGRLPFADTPNRFDRRYVRPEPDLTMLPAAERPVIARALARVPQERWPSCAEMVARLAERIPSPPASAGGQVA